MMWFWKQWGWVGWLGAAGLAYRADQMPITLACVGMVFIHGLAAWYETRHH